MARVLLLLVALTGCLVNVDFGNGPYLCSDEAPSCPDGLECRDGVCTSEPIDAGIPADAALPPSVEPHLIGDLLFLDFDDAPGLSVLRDRSGRRRDAIPSTSGGRIAGQYGSGIDPDLISVVIPDFADLFVGSAGVTIEAWVKNGGATPAVIFGDLNVFPAPTTMEMGLYISDVDELTFAVQESCGGPLIAATTTFTLSSASHVAVTWDRSEVRFYKNSIQVGAAIGLVADGCQLARDYRVGDAVGGTGELVGLIDELKVSSLVKTAEQIADSMAFDSAVNNSDCGNRVLDPAEECDSDSICCDAGSCLFDAVGVACGGSGTCNAGVCQVSSGRSNAGVLLAYDFAGIAGGIVSDISGLDPPLDLTITPLTAVIVKGETLAVIDEVVDISTAATTAKVAGAIQSSRDFTIEAWIQPANDTQGAAQPTARIVTMSPDQSSRNFALGQTGDRYVARLMSSASNANGQPILHTRASAVRTTSPTHLLVTRESNGNRRMYLDGVLVDQSVLEGTLPWDDTLPIRLAHEGVAPRPFLGTYYFLAIYEGAFSEQRAAAHFLAGP